MRLSPRDWFATAVVAVATLVAALWAVDAAVPALGSARATGAAVLACGFVASAAAVVPGFDRLIRGSRAYLAATSVMGFAALGAGIGVLVTGDGWWLAALVACTLVLWIVATAHHVRADERQHREIHPAVRGPRRPAAA